MKRATLPRIKIPSAKNEDQPASRRMLRLVRDEMKSDFRAISRKMDSRFNDMEARFKGIDSRFNEMEARFKNIDSRFNDMEARFKTIDARFDKIDARFKQVDSRFDELISRFDEMKSDHFRTQVLLEEQHANNRIVLEGLQALWQRQDRIEQRLPRTP